MVSDEALAFVDLMRRDDMDRRASNASTATSPDERGEPTNEQVADRYVQEPYSTEGDKADQSILFQESGENPTPAETISEVALGVEPLLASSSESEYATPPQVFSEPGHQAEPYQPPQDSASITGKPQDSQSDSGLPAEAAELFSQQQQDHHAPNEALQSEGVSVTEIPNLNGETTFIVPEGMQGFEEMLRTFDRDYKPPEDPIGDIEIPELEETDYGTLDALQNTSEFAEAMIAEMSRNILDTERSEL